MNIPTLWRIASRSCYQALTNIQRISYDGMSVLNRGMHCICSNKSFAITERISPYVKLTELLAVQTPSLVPTCGFKVKGQPKLRCKGCYFVVREERLYVFCKLKPRHKQMAMKAKPRKSWILTHATQGPQRAW